MLIPDKATFKRLSAAGRLGNTFRQWDTLAALKASDYFGWLTVRAMRPGDKHLFVPAILRNEIRAWAWGKVTDGRVYFQECPAPDTGRIINLEACHGPCPWSNPSLYVRYALNDPTNLRHSLEQNGRDVEGLAAWHVLERYLGEDLDVLRDIWADYPDAIIEASRFSRAVGTLNSKLIIWEVRNF